MKTLLGLVLISLVLITGCSTKNINTSANAILTSQKLIVESARAIDSLCTSGELSQSSCDKASDLYYEAKDLYSAAIEAELIFIDASLNDVQETEYDYLNRIEMISRMSSIAGRLMEISNGH